MILTLVFKEGLES